MIRATPYPNILWVCCPMGPWQNHNPETYRATLVALVEISAHAVKLWYVHHQFEERPQSGEGDWKVESYHRFEMTESMRGSISHHVMQEFWRTYVHPEVMEITPQWPGITDDVPAEVRDAAKKLGGAGKKTRG